MNLAWKLAAVLRGNAAAPLLDTYEPERIAFARRLVGTTDRGFTGVTSPGWLARLLRLRIVPLILPVLFRFRTVQQYLFRTISQTAVNYRGSTLSEGQAGVVHGGDRLPWVRTQQGANAQDNYAPLTSLAWQVHVYGEAPAEIIEVCHEKKLPLHIFSWTAAMSKTGLKRNVVYLVRPDGYVGWVDAIGGAAALAAYLEKRGLTFQE